MKGFWKLCGPLCRILCPSLCRNPVNLADLIDKVPGEGATPRFWDKLHVLSSMLLPALLLGCRSAPPPVAPPASVAMAERAEAQAAKLSAQQQNWPAAARAW